MSHQPSIFSRIGHSVASHVRKQWKSHLGTVALVIAVLVAGNAWRTRDLPQGVAPDFTVKLATGETTTLSQWRAAYPGQAVALHFWADWCPICRAEEHNVTRVAKDWPVLSVAMRSGDSAKVRTVLSQRQLNWPTVVDTQGEVSSLYGVKAVPAFAVIDAQGQLRGASSGYTSELSMRLRLWWAQTFQS